jgi:hypothetical protein
MGHKAEIAVNGRIAVDMYKNGDYESEWAVLTTNEKIMKSLKFEKGTSKIHSEKRVTLWSDDFNSIMEILK